MSYTGKLGITPQSILAPLSVGDRLVSQQVLWCHLVAFWGSYNGTVANVWCRLSELRADFGKDQIYLKRRGVL